METKPVIRGGRYQLKYRGTECLNCGHPLELSDRYCPNCSQENSTKRLKLADFFDEFFNNVLSWDSRLFKTLYALILRPGRISLDYVAGKRKRYTNPFRFLLSLAIVYFLLLNLTGNFSEFDRYGRGNVSFELPTLSDTPPVNFTVNGQNISSTEAVKVLDSLQLKEQIEASQRRKDSLIEADPAGYYAEIREEGLFTRADFFMHLIDRDTLYAYPEAVDKYGLPEERGDRMAFGLAQSVDRMSRQPGTFLSEVIAKLPFATFFFLPIFAVFVWLVYIRKKYTYTDNLVFSFHIQSLFFILLIIGFLTDTLIGVELYWLCILAFSVYLYAAMRKFYKQNHFKTILKFLFLNTVFVILATIAVVLVFIGSAATY